MSENKKALSIDDLPDEVLLQIFAFFDESSIINAMDACERWDELITAKTTLHAKLSLNLSSNSRHSENIKYQKLKASIIWSETDKKRQMEIFQRNKETIKEAEIAFSTWSFVEKDLMKMKNLVKLNLSRIKFIQTPAKLSLLSLKELKIDRSPDFLDVPNLVKLSYTGPRFPTKFIKTCKKLTHLTYRFFPEDGGKVPTALRAISHRLKFLNVTVEERTSLIPLLQSQKAYLKELEIDSYGKEEIEFAINRMRLHKLNIHVRNITVISRTSDLKTLSNNSTIKELHLAHYGSHSNSTFQALRKVLQSCSSTEKLIMFVNSHETQLTVMMASEYLPNLKHLVIRQEYYVAKTENPPLNIIQTFDSMESMHLTLHCVKNMNAYLRLIANCPNLRKLKVSFIPWDHNIEHILATVPDLHELIVDRVFMLSEEVIRSLKRSKIRILKFTVNDEEFEEQQKLAIQLSKQGDIRCTVFSDKGFKI